MSSNPSSGPEFVCITPEHLYELCKDKLGTLGKTVWDFYATLRRKLEHAGAGGVNPTYIFPKSTFTSERKSEFQVRGLNSVPDRELQELTYTLPNDVDLRVKKYKNSDNTWNLVLDFELQVVARDKSPVRRQDYAKAEEVVLSRREKLDSSRKKKSTTSMRSRSSSSEKAKRLSSSDSDSHSQRSSRGERSSSESDSPATVFRRSKTPSKSRGRSQSISRKPVLRMSEEEAKKVNEELEKRDALLVKVKPLEPPKQKRWGIF